MDGKGCKERSMERIQDSESGRLGAGAGGRDGCVRETKRELEMTWSGPTGPYDKRKKNLECVVKLGGG